MALPNWIKRYLLVKSPQEGDQDAVPMAKLYSQSPGDGMQAFFDKVFRKYYGDPIFQIDDEGIAHSWSPRFNNSSDIQKAITQINSDFLNPEIIGLVFTDIVGKAEWSHSTIGLIKIATVFITPESEPFTNSVIDDFVSSYGTSRFTDCGHSIDQNNRPVFMTKDDVWNWKRTEIAAQNLHSRSGVLLGGL